MNNIYNGTFYPHTRNDMCFDNKGMVSPAATERTASPTVRVNIPAVIDKTQHSQPTKIRFRKRVTLPVALNTCLLVVVLSLLVLAEYGFIPATRLGYYCQDPLISHKYKGEVVSPLVLGLGSLFLPLLTLLFTEAIATATLRKIDYSRVWYCFKECAIGCVLVLTLTEIAKVLVGEHRPHFLDVCRPDTAEECVTGSFVDSYTCTSTRYSNYFLADSSRSFPSGHSSVSWFVGMFSAYVVHTRISTLLTGRLLKPFLIAVCFTWSLVCSLTRITDRRHHWWDVLAGAVLGIAGALYTIRLVHKKMHGVDGITQVCSSTTALIDIKNKQATSVII